MNILPILNDYSLCKVNNNLTKELYILSIWQSINCPVREKTNGQEFKCSVDAIEHLYQEHRMDKDAVFQKYSEFFSYEAGKLKLSEILKRSDI